MEVIVVMSLLLGAAFGLVALDEKRRKYETEDADR